MTMTERRKARKQGRSGSVHNVVLPTTVENQALDVGLMAFSIAMALDIPVPVHKMKMPLGPKLGDRENLSAFMCIVFSAMSREL